MLQKTLILLFITCSALPGFGCGCGGPVNELQVDIDSSDAIFIGVITDVNMDQSFHLANGNGNGLNYLNFDIFRIYKGLNRSLLKVSVFDNYSNSSCEGLLMGKTVGDTVLVFADEFKPSMIGSYLCGRHPTFKTISPEEQTFMDTATWHDPLTKHSTINKDLNKNKYPKQDIDHHISTKGIPFNLLLFSSLFLNFLLIVAIGKNKSK